MYTVHFVEYGVEFSTQPESAEVVEEVIRRLFAKGITNAYKREAERPSNCAKCGRTPNGNSPDNVSFTICHEHTICNECMDSHRRHGGTGCPVCKRKK